MDKNQPAHAFFEFANIGLLFFGDGATVRQAHQFLRFFAQFLTLNFAQANKLRSMGTGFFFSSSSVLVCGFNQRQVGLLVTDGAETVAQTLNFTFFDFFHGGLIY